MKDRFVELMKKHARALGGDGRIISEITADLEREDPWFVAHREETRAILRYTYEVPEARE
jgi:hypothetical protein